MARKTAEERELHGGIRKDLAMQILPEIITARKRQTSTQFSQLLPVMIRLVEDEWSCEMATERGSVDTTRQSLLRMVHHSLGTINEMDNTRSIMKKG